MFVDARTISNDTIIETDICIIGAGAAGITLARQFIGQPFRVAVLESGGQPGGEFTGVVGQKVPQTKVADDGHSIVTTGSVKNGG